MALSDLLVNPIVYERLAGAVGAHPFTPFRAGSGVSRRRPERSRRKGESPRPLSGRKGRNSPPANPERATAGASERRAMGFTM